MVFILTTLLYFVEISVSIKAELGFPPWILSEFKPRYYLPLSHSSRLTINCSARNGNVSYQWYKNNIELTTGHQNVFIDSNGGITFQTLDKEDYGLYHCTSRNDYGISVSPFFEIKEATLGFFSETRNETKSCDEYHYCNLTCSKGPPCEPKYDCSIQWEIRNGTVNSVTFNDNIAIDTEGTLHFLNISASSDGMNYFCGIWNKKLNIFAQSKEVTTIHVNDVDISEKDVPPDAIYKGDVKAIVGENARLQCIFSGNPVPKLKWQNKRGSIIESNEKYKIRDYGRELQIMNVTFDDEGEYTCESESNLKMSPYLNVTCPPVFPGVERSFLMKYVTLSNMEKLGIQCNAKSAPGELNPTVVKWMKNGIDISPDSSHVFSEENRTLYITQNFTEGGGCYTCVATNSEGIAVGNFLLVPNGRSLKMVLTVIISITSGLSLLMFGGLIVQRIHSKMGVEKTYGQAQRHDTNTGHSNMVLQVNSGPVIDISDNLYYMPDDEDMRNNMNVVNPVNNCGDYNPSNEYSVFEECFSTSSHSSEYKIEHSDMVEQIYTDPDILILDHLYYMPDNENMLVDTNVINPVNNYSNPANDYSISGECLSTSSESQKNNIYDCTGNVSGIYDTSVKRIEYNDPESPDFDHIYAGDHFLIWRSNQMAFQRLVKQQAKHVSSQSRRKERFTSNRPDETMDFLQTFCYHQ